MARARKPAESSVAVLKLGRGEHPLAPYRSLRQAVVSLLLVLLGLLAVDRLVIPRMGAYLPDEGWHREDAALVQNMMRRNEARLDGDWVWRSRGRPVGVERSLERTQDLINSRRRFDSIPIRQKLSDEEVARFAVLRTSPAPIRW